MASHLTKEERDRIAQLHHQGAQQEGRPKGTCYFYSAAAGICRATDWRHKARLSRARCRGAMEEGGQATGDGGQGQETAIAP